MSEGGLKRLWRRLGVKNAHERVYLILGLVAGVLVAPAIADTGRSGEEDNFVETFFGSGWTTFLIITYMVGLMIYLARRHPALFDRVRPERRIPVVSISVDQLQRQAYFGDHLRSIDRAALASCLSDQPELDADEPYGSLSRTANGFAWTPADRFSPVGVPSLWIPAADIDHLSAGSGNVVDDCHFTNLHLVDGSTISFKTTVAVVYGRAKRPVAEAGAP